VVANGSTEATRALLAVVKKTTAALETTAALNTIALVAVEDDWAVEGQLNFACECCVRGSRRRGPHAVAEGIFDLAKIAGDLRPQAI
jgi:hypothetical protein